MSTCVQGLPSVDEAASAAAKVTAAMAAALALSVSPAHAALDTDTYKAGPGATIEYSDIKDQSASDVVKSLKEQVMPKAEEKLGEAADRAGGQYPDSIVQELKTVKSEIEALERQVAGGGQDESVVKSAASAIEQQVNALKALLGFD